MKKRISLYILGLLMITSCTQILDIDLNSVEPQIVIEGRINQTKTERSVNVIISKTINFSDKNDFPMISKAFVEITDGEGNKKILNEYEPGWYSTILPINGSTEYNLKVVIDNKTYTSQSIIPERVNFDSLTIEKSTDGFDTEDKYDMWVNYVDPKGIQNFYHFTEIVNGHSIREYIFDDRLSDGSDKGNKLSRSDRKLFEGDTVKVIMRCIDKNVYNYYNSLGYMTGGNPTNSATPANPYTNIEGATLGYFSAHTYEIIETIVE